MTIKSIVTQQIQQIADENGLGLVSLTDDTVLTESGLDSMAMAILVVRLEEELGLDPFAEDNTFPAVATLADFVKFYEGSAKSDAVDSRRAR